MTSSEGLLAWMETSDGTRRTHTSNGLGRPTGTTLRIDGIDYSYGMTYDTDGRLATLQYPTPTAT